MTGRCPWYVSAHAVRQWQRWIRSAPRDFDDASDSLIEICAAVWAAYRASGREPETHTHGGYVYHAGRAHERIRLIVSQQRRTEGDLQQIVDVLPRHAPRRR